MNPFIEEADRLLRLARKDRLACKLLLPVEELASSVASFHAQQAAEKALKPILEPNEALALADQLITWGQEHLANARKQLR